MSGMLQDPTPRQRFIMALNGEKPSGRVPTFETVFYLSMELLGKVHPVQRTLSEWDQMSPREKQAQIADAADVYLSIARHYNHSAIFVHGVQGMPGSEQLIAQSIREKVGDEYFLMRHGDATLGIPDGDGLWEVCFSIADDPATFKRRLEKDVDAALHFFEPLSNSKLFDGICLATDYCLNTGPFLSPSQFSEFVSPFLSRLIHEYRSMGYYTIKHTDGNIMPILDQLVQCRPHALHSLDPQAGVDIGVVKRQCGKSLCLIGNVNSATLQSGSDAEVIESCRYALRQGMPGGGYIYATSNCIYPGMTLERYDLMLDVWRQEGFYST